MREIVLDTETTGLDPASGHRIAEVGCVELLNHVPTGRTFHRYVNPERPMPAEAAAVHGLTDAFLSGHPRFAEIAADLVAFLADSPLVIHNAAFDLGFLNAEFERLGLAALPPSRAIDTVKLARQRFPGAPANLDALCRRFDIDVSGRALHGALKDAELLAQVYLELKGGRQPGLMLLSPAMRALSSGAATAARPSHIIAPNAQEAEAHAAFIARLSNPLWTAEA
jgi:DNA polymerase-3 subunit epsilon